MLRNCFACQCVAAVNVLLTLRSCRRERPTVRTTLTVAYRSVNQLPWVISPRDGLRRRENRNQELQPALRKEGGRQCGERKDYWPSAS